MKQDKQIKQAIKDNALYKLTKFEAVWYFTQYEGKEDIIWGIKPEDYENPTGYTRWIVLDKKTDQQAFDIITKHIKKEGTKFFTSDEDIETTYGAWDFDLIRGMCKGYYLNKETSIDFEPLDLGPKYDLGHTYLYYLDRENKEYKEL